MSQSLDPALCSINTDTSIHHPDLSSVVLDIDQERKAQQACLGMEPTKLVVPQHFTKALSELNIPVSAQQEITVYGDTKAVMLPDGHSGVAYKVPPYEIAISKDGSVFVRGQEGHFELALSRGEKNRLQEIGVLDEHEWAGNHQPVSKEFNVKLTALVPGSGISVFSEGDIYKLKDSKLEVAFTKDGQMLARSEGERHFFSISGVLQNMARLDSFEIKPHSLQVHSDPSHGKGVTFETADGDTFFIYADKVLVRKSDWAEPSQLDPQTGLIHLQVDTLERELAAIDSRFPPGVSFVDKVASESNRDFKQLISEDLELKGAREYMDENWSEAAVSPEDFVRYRQYAQVVRDQLSKDPKYLAAYEQWREYAEQYKEIFDSGDDLDIEVFKQLGDALESQSRILVKMIQDEYNLAVYSSNESAGGGAAYLDIRIPPPSRREKYTLEGLFGMEFEDGQSRHRPLSHWADLKTKQEFGAALIAANGPDAVNKAMARVEGVSQNGSNPSLTPEGTFFDPFHPDSILVIPAISSLDPQDGKPAMIIRSSHFEKAEDWRVGKTLGVYHLRTGRISLNEHNYGRSDVTVATATHEIFHAFHSVLERKEHTEFYTEWNKTQKDLMEWLKSQVELYKQEPQDSSLASGGFSSQVVNYLEYATTNEQEFFAVMLDLYVHKPEVLDALDEMLPKGLQPGLSIHLTNLLAYYMGPEIRATR